MKPAHFIQGFDIFAKKRGWLRWRTNKARTLVCPACHETSSMASRLDTSSPAHQFHRFALYECPHCQSGFFPDLKPPAYEGKKAKQGAHIRETAALKYYLEQGAGLLSMAQPLLRLRHLKNCSMLEVGCGYGFALHFARQALGWTVRGFDPSSLAKIGAQDLDLRIEPAYLDAQSAPKHGPFDVVYSSEVIEHVARPDQFLKPICDVLQDDGVLVLTTPDIAGLRTERDLSSLLPLVSPGSHLVLFSKTGLEQTLRRAGFCHIDLSQNGDTLIAIAARTPLQLPGDNQQSAQMYRDYVHAQAAVFTKNHQLFTGFAGRALKEQINIEHYAQAKQLLHKLSASWKQQYAIDISQPDTLEFADPSAVNFEKFAMQTPLNLVMVLYHIGILVMNTAQDLPLAQHYFSACVRAQKSIQRALHNVNVVDIENDILASLAQALSIGLLANSDPVRAMELLKIARQDEIVPACALAYTNAALDVFSAAANTGIWDVARPLFDESTNWVLQTQSMGDRERSAAIGAAMLSLNDTFDRKTGLFWLNLALSNAPNVSPWKELKQVWADHASARGVEVLAAGGRGALAASKDEICNGLLARPAQTHDFDVLVALGHIDVEQNPLMAITWFKRALQVARKDAKNDVRALLEHAKLQGFLHAVAGSDLCTIQKFKPEIRTLAEQNIAPAPVLLALAINALNNENAPCDAMKWVQKITELQDTELQDTELQDTKPQDEAIAHQLISITDIAYEQIQDRLIKASAKGQYKAMDELQIYIPKPLDIDRPEVHYAIAMYQMNYKNDLNKAAKHFSLAAKLAPNTILRDDARFHQSIALARAGQSTKARKIANQIFANDNAGTPPHPLAHRKQELDAEIKGKAGT